MSKFISRTVVRDRDRRKEVGEEGGVGSKVIQASRRGGGVLKSNGGRIQDKTRLTQNICKTAGAAELRH